MSEPTLLSLIGAAIPGVVPFRRVVESADRDELSLRLHLCFGFR